MARLNDRRCHIAFMDSRGVGLLAKIDCLNQGEYLEVCIHKGATLHQLTRRASEHLTSYPFDVVYILGGACDITTRDEVTKKISFDWAPASKVASHLLDSLKLEDKFMQSNHPTSRVVFCPLVGTELVRVVNAHGVTDEQQAEVDNAIFEFNNEIFNVNRKRQSFSPSLHSSIHRSKGRTRKNHYHLLTDGIHLSEHQMDKWARELVKSTSYN